MRFITDGLTGQVGLGVDDKGVFAPVRPRGFAPRNRLCSSDARGGAAAAGQAARHLLKALTRVLNLKATLPSAANLGPQRVEALHDLPTTWPSVVKASFERTRDPLHYKPFTAPEEARLQQIYPGAHCLVGCVGGRGWGGGGGGGDACAAFGSVVSAFTVRWRARAACARGDVAALHRSTNMQAA